ncbi:MULTISPECIES: ABC transporter permease [Streptomyces]|uniref:ABC transporter permease n=1 Tax=Streptomyces tsukubensis (strain DSM 42081 / NBRC 108919 / NRRL 18488 / 9993) TaxID=1114943 RepID=I2N3C6_STRT9|nr:MULTISPECIES: ABC transporter permease [Streptomyces]AZK95611.1 glutathione ABC transporter permease GsiC [Streptomyces tsukubensis]EIF91523.1 peptide ABC transporter permease [Streptomyces tsukubensis NRRL18488]MYS68437.1 ABC transporter permease subunit [Streptomyces sp. SID5473]QKM68354.1 ABC transporter permease [Streptomyces tsukubensis NRRL18488]TAI43171.1 ABC transporter permease [Streptomyces tsukubensis]
MLTFTLRRALQMIPVVLGVTVATFALGQIIPGDQATALLGPTSSEEDRQALRADLGLDEPAVSRYFTYLGNLFGGDLGRSLSFGRPVSEVISERLLNTFLLSGTAIVVAAVAGVAIGTWAAMKPGSARDRGLTVGVLFLNSVPSFWFGLVLIVVFSLQLRMLPATGMTSIGGGGGVLDVLAHMVLPVITLSAWSLAVIARMTRSAVLEVIGNDYVRTARSRGVGELRVVTRHVLPNAMPSVVTVIGLQAGFLLSGAVLTETVFSWPGIGLALHQAISTRDIPLVQGGILMIAIAFVLINFLVDVVQAYFNPKIKLA